MTGALEFAGDLVFCAGFVGSERDAAVCALNDVTGKSELAAADEFVQGGAKNLWMKARTGASAQVLLGDSGNERILLVEGIDFALDARRYGPHSVCRNGDPGLLGNDTYRFCISERTRCLSHQ